MSSHSIIYSQIGNVSYAIGIKVCFSVVDSLTSVLLIMTLPGAASPSLWLEFPTTLSASKAEKQESLAHLRFQKLLDES